MYTIWVTFTSSGKTKEWPVTYETYQTALTMANTIAGRPGVWRSELRCGPKTLFQVNGYQM